MGQGIVISQDLNNSSNFVVNFFDNDEYESDSSLNIHEVLVLPLIDDYLNHDFQSL